MKGTGSLGIVEESKMISYSAKENVVELLYRIELELSLDYRGFHSSKVKEYPRATQSFTVECLGFFSFLKCEFSTAGYQFASH